MLDKSSRRKSRRTSPCRRYQKLLVRHIRSEADIGLFQEFAKLSDDANIYKLVGPVLMKQDKNDAKMAVDGRLEYIAKEMFVCHQTCRASLTIVSKRIESQIKDIQEKSEAKKMEIFQLQTQAQQQPQAA